MADAVFNIIVGVQNRERIKQLEKDISDAETEIERLSRAINVAGQATAQQTSQLRMYGGDIQAYRKEIEQLTNENIRLGESTGDGSTSVRGIRTMTRALNELGGGSGDLLMTLPSLAIALGAGGMFAEGIALTAGLMETLNRHWSDLQDMFDSREGIDRAKSNLESLVEYLDNLDSAFGRVGSGFLGMFKESSEQSSIKAKIEDFRKQRIGTGGRLADQPNREEIDRGRIFKEMVEQHGPEKFFTEAVRRETGGRDLTPSQQDEVEKRVLERIGQAERGIYPPEAKQMFGGIDPEKERQFREASKLNVEGAKNEEISRQKMIADAKKMTDDERRGKEKIQKAEDAWGKELDASADLLKKQEANALQDQLTKLERQKRDVAEWQREHPAPGFAIHRGGQAIAEAIQGDLGIGLQKQQLVVQKAMQFGIDQVRDELKKLQRAGGAVAQ